MGKSGLNVHTLKNTHTHTHTLFCTDSAAQQSVPSLSHNEFNNSAARVCVCVCVHRHVHLSNHGLPPFQSAFLLVPWSVAPVTQAGSDPHARTLNTAIKCV